MSEVEEFEKSLDAAKSLFVRGISKHVTAEQIVSHFSAAGSINEWCYHPTNRGIIYVTYGDEIDAQNAVRRLHQSELLGVTISVRPLNYNKNIKNNKSMIERDSIITRNIIKKQNKTKGEHVAYANHGMLINGDLYPIPQGRYLLQLLKLSLSCDFHVKSLLSQLIFTKSNNNDNNKEISESYACFNGMLKAGNYLGINWSDETVQVNVYVLGDGVQPFTSILLAALLPTHYRIYSIDPLLKYSKEQLGEDNVLAKRINMYPCLSEEFEIPVDDNMGISVLIACHSHAPLQQFWDRVRTKKIAISMPCCGKDISLLSMSPTLEYEDYEVWSPKRKIYIYSSL